MIVAQRHLVVAVSLEAVDQLLVVANFALQRRGVLDNRRLERLEAVALEHAGECVKDILPQDHRLRQVVAHAFDVLGSAAHTASCLGCEMCIYDTMLADDVAKVLTTLQQGLASEDHVAFTARLQELMKG